jgi:hypothetical protein
MTCQRCHVANLAHNIPHPQLTRKGYQPRTHAFSLLARSGEVKPYLVCFAFWIPQFVDIARGSTRGVWCRFCTRCIGPIECQSGSAGQLNDFDRLPCMPRSPRARANWGEIGVHPACPAYPPCPASSCGKGEASRPPNVRTRTGGRP